MEATGAWTWGWGFWKLLGTAGKAQRALKCGGERGVGGGVGGLPTAREVKAPRPKLLQAECCPARRPRVSQRPWVRVGPGGGRRSALSRDSQAAQAQRSARPPGKDGGTWGACSLGAVPQPGAGGCEGERRRATALPWAQVTVTGPVSSGEARGRLRVYLVSLGVSHPQDPDLSAKPVTVTAVRGFPWACGQRPWFLTLRGVTPGAHPRSRAQPPHGQRPPAALPRLPALQGAWERAGVATCRGVLGGKYKN